MIDLVKCVVLFYHLKRVQEFSSLVVEFVILNSNKNRTCTKNSYLGQSRKILHIKDARLKIGTEAATL